MHWVAFPAVPLVFGIDRVAFYALCQNEAMEILRLVLLAKSREIVATVQ